MRRHRIAITGDTMTTGFTTVPDATRLRLKNARMPAALLVERVAGPADGLLDVTIERGVVTDVAPAGGGPWEGASVDLDGGLVLPAFVDMHTHLDKGHIWPRAWNVDGTIAASRDATSVDRQAHWRMPDVERRFEFALRCASAHGTVAIRTHLDCFELAQSETSWGVFRTLRDRWASRIAIQAVSLTTVDDYSTNDGRALADLVAESGGVLGGITRLRDPAAPSEALDACLDRLFAMAAERGVDVDLHVDETGDPASNTLAQVASAVLRAGFRGRVVCGHCCSLSVQDDATVARTIALCAEAGLTVVSLPMINQYLQGRIAGGTPRWRGVTLLRELAAAGVPVAVASDNCRDPYYAFGDQDMLEVFEQAVRIGHLDLDWENWLGAVGAVPAAAMRLSGRGRIGQGMPADLLLFRARTMSELHARPQADRIVLRAGRAIDTVLPDYRELDDLCR